MSNSANHNSKAPKGFKPTKLTAILGGIIVILIIAIVVMLALIPDNPDPVETVPATTQITIETTEPSEPTVSDETVVLPTVSVVGGEYVPPEMLSNMADLYTKNADIGGWLKIADTVIDYPVMYTPEEPHKYLYMSFEGKYKYRGELYIDDACPMNPDGPVILIHGHNMNDGSMFQSLLNYKSQKYWESHPTISFNTLYEERTYEIFAAFRVGVPKLYSDEKEGEFYYYRFTNPTTEEEFNEGISYFKEMTTYDMGIDAEYGDKLIMLSTCDKSIYNGRFVVVGRLVTEDETVETP